GVQDADGEQASPGPDVHTSGQEADARGDAGDEGDVRGGLTEAGGTVHGQRQMDAGEEDGGDEAAAGHAPAGHGPTLGEAGPGHLLPDVDDDGADDQVGEVDAEYRPGERAGTA